MVGNGGYGSAIAYGPLADFLRRGDPALATDTGYSGDDPFFAQGHPESIVDRATGRSTSRVGELRGLGSRFDFSAMVEAAGVGRSGGLSPLKLRGMLKRQKRHTL